MIVIELKSRIEEVIPWGYICEDYLWHLVNNNFVSKNSYRLKKSKRLQIVEKLEYWIGMNEAASNLVRDYTVNQ